LLSANNIAMYGGLCALASFDRQELLKHVISSRYDYLYAHCICCMGRMVKYIIPNLLGFTKTSFTKTKTFHPQST